MAHVATVTIDHTKVAGDLTDYVVAVINDTDAGWAELYALCLEGGGDIRLYKSDDVTELARELVTFSASAETGEIHIKYSGTLSSSVDTDIHVYADGSSADYAVTDTYGRNNVWTGFGFVLHSGGGTDSTGNSTPTSAGGVTVGGATGVLGAATTFDGVNDEVKVPHSSSVNIGALSDNYTITTWAKTSSTATALTLASKFDTTAANGSDKLPFLHWFNQNIAGQFGSAYRGTNSTYNFRQNPTTGQNNGAWRYSGFIHKGSATEVSTFANDSTLTTVTRAAVGTTMANTCGVTIGYLDNAGTKGFYFSGDICEVRLRTANAISQSLKDTEYENQNSPSTFYAVAAVSAGIAYTQDLPEAATANDTIKRDTTKTLGENATGADAIIKGKASRYTENVTANDSANTLIVKLQELLEAVGVSDTLARAITRNFTEAATAADTLVKDINKALAEAVNIVASATALTATYAKLLLEGVTASDSVNRLVGYTRNLVEAVGVADYFKIAKNGINALWSDLYTDTADAWSDLYNNDVDVWTDKYRDN